MDTIQEYVTAQVKAQADRLVGDLRKYIVAQIKSRLAWLIWIPLTIIGVLAGGVAIGLGVAWLLRRQQRRKSEAEIATAHKPLMKASEAVVLPAPAAEREVRVPRPVVSNGKPTAEKAVVQKTASKDDLTRIIGLGPKSEDVLKAAGITTFRQVAEMKPETLKKVLEEGGMTRLQNYETWPQQAVLAAEGKWEDLEALVAKLRGEEG